MENQIIKYITEEALVLMPVLFILGLLLKNTPKVQDWLIPWTLLVVGVVVAIIMIGDVLQGIVQGVLVAGATVLNHQLIKQTTNKK